MDCKSERDYGTTLAFSVRCSSFSDQSTDAPSQTFVRTFDIVSANLSQFGCWRCVLEETKRQHHSTIELHLTLSWVPSPDPLPADQGSTSTHQSQRQELISQITSVKIVSDTTLSELLIKHLDGQFLLKGGFIKVRLQADRVLRNGRYKFRICFYTQDITQHRAADRPIVTPFLDLDDYFDPMDYKEEPPDITFRFLKSKVVKEDTTILAHSSALQESRYFTEHVKEAREEREREGEAFTGLTCLISEFSPPVFRTMLRFLYMGRLELKSRSKEAERKVISSSCSSNEPEPLKVKASGKWTARNEDMQPLKCNLQDVYFEDLYRISERYEIPKLKALSLKAMQCSLNMSIAIGMLANLPGEPREAVIGLAGQNQEERRFNSMQMDLVLDTIKEYVHFFGLEATNLVKGNRDARVHLSTEDRVELVQYIGDFVLNNISRLWEKV